MFKYPAYKYGGMVLYGQHGISDWFRSRAGTRTGVGFYTDHLYNGLRKIWDPKKGAEADYGAAKSYLLDQGYDEDELDAYAKGEDVDFSNSNNIKDRTRALDIMRRDYSNWKGIRNTSSNNSGSEDNVTQVDENEGNETPVEENPEPAGGNGTGGSAIGGTPGEISGPAPGQGQGEGQGEAGYDIDALQALYQQFHDLFEQWGNSQNQSEETEEEEPEEESGQEQTPALDRHDLMGLQNWQLRSLRKGYGVDMGNGVTLKAANKKAGRQAARAIRREKRLDNMPFNVGTNTGAGFRYGPMTYSED